MSDVRTSNGSDWVYSDTVKEHFFRPKNILCNEKGFKADGIGYVGSPACGDMMKVWIKVNKKADQITDFKWRTFGCASAIGSTSMLSMMVTEGGGMTIKDALKITPQDIMKRLGGLPDNKIHCSVLGDKALRAAVNNYFANSGQKNRIVRDQAKVVCECLNVTDHEIEDAVLEGKRTFEDVQRATKVSTGCGKCKPNVEKLIEKFNTKYYGD